MTPMHCAAINPNPKYLSQLLAILPDYNIMDGCRRRLIHYAVACEGTGPLQLLLDRCSLSVHLQLSLNRDTVDFCYSAEVNQCKPG